MKHLICFLMLASGTFTGFAQNSYPYSGNVKVLATDEGWAEGLLVIKQNGWAGIRLARYAPSTGTYQGNWAIGYNASTGDDFSITTYNGGQYDGLFHISNATRNIGIGTTAPEAKLEIASAVTGGSTLIFGGIIGSKHPGHELNLTGGKPTESAPSQGGHIRLCGNGRGDSGVNAIQFFQNGVERMRVHDGGLVGIGTIPSYKFHVKSTDFQSVLQTDGTGNNRAIMAFADAGGNLKGSVGLFAADGSIRIGDADNYQIVMKQGGNVGIGTTSPDAKLTVNGQIHATEVKVTTTVPTPDYVFEKSYDLLSLDEVKSYIDENKHLPEVPSAKEMEKNGINLSEMNMLLLKKVEELTLYAIDQNRNIERMRQENKEFRAIIEELLMESKKK